MQQLLKLLNKGYAGYSTGHRDMLHSNHLRQFKNPTPSSHLIKTVVSVFNEHSLFIGLVLLFGLSAICVSLLFPTRFNLSFSLYNDFMLISALLYVGLFFFWRVIMMMLHDKPRKPIQYLFIDIRTNYITCERITLLALFLVTFPIFSSSFTYLKSMIPILNPFSWDPSLCKLDRLIHFGVDPWRLLHPIIGSPHITQAINILYNLWIFFWFFYLFYLYFSLDKRAVRMQFIVSFILCWGVIGVLLATLFSSAGPCYFGRLYPDDPYYKDLMDYLLLSNQVHDIWALNVQDALWQHYLRIDLGAGSGISAMPSMHVSLTFLITLAHYRINRKVAHLILLYTFVILIGSVHLGWHYAVDGYVSIVMTYAIWYASGKIIKCKP